MPGRLQGKVTLVTGGSSGIGRASARACAREGARVMVADVAVEGGHETVRLIQEAGGEATFMRVDVTQATDVAALIANIVASMAGSTVPITMRVSRARSGLLPTARKTTGTAFSASTLKACGCA